MFRRCAHLPLPRSHVGKSSRMLQSRHFATTPPKALIALGERISPTALTLGGIFAFALYGTLMKLRRDRTRRRHSELERAQMSDSALLDAQMESKAMEVVESIMSEHAVQALEAKQVLEREKEEAEGDGAEESVSLSDADVKALLGDVSEDEGEEDGDGEVGEAPPAGNRDEYTPELLHLVQSTVEEVLGNPEHATVVELYHQGCPACEALGPRVRQAAAILARAAERGNEAAQRVRIAQLNGTANWPLPPIVASTRFPLITRFEPASRVVKKDGGGEGHGSATSTTESTKSTTEGTKTATEGTRASSEDTTPPQSKKRVIVEPAPKELRMLEPGGPATPQRGLPSVWDICEFAAGAGSLDEEARKEAERAEAEVLRLNFQQSKGRWLEGLLMILNDRVQPLEGPEEGGGTGGEGGGEGVEEGEGDGEVKVEASPAFQEALDLCRATLYVARTVSMRRAGSTTAGKGDFKELGRLMGKAIACLEPVAATAPDALRMQLSHMLFMMLTQIEYNNHFCGDHDNPHTWTAGPTATPPETELSNDLVKTRLQVAAAMATIVKTFEDQRA